MLSNWASWYEATIMPLIADFSVPSPWQDIALGLFAKGGTNGLELWISRPSLIATLDDRQGLVIADIWTLRRRVGRVANIVVEQGRPLDFLPTELFTHPPP